MVILYIVDASNYKIGTGVFNYVNYLCNALKNRKFNIRILVLDHQNNIISCYLDNEIIIKTASILDFTKAFENFMKEHLIGLIHFHNVFTKEINTVLLQTAKNRAIKTLLTIHNSTLLCYRDSLAFKNKTFCSNNRLVFRCINCLSERHFLGTAIFALNVVNYIGFKDQLFFNTKRLHYSTDVKNFNQNSINIFKAIDYIIILDRWVEDYLHNTILYSDKIIYIPQTPFLPNHQIIERPIRVQPKNYQLVYIGRTDITKGLKTLVEALKGIKNVTLDCYLTITDIEYYNKIMSFIKKNKLNVTINSPINHNLMAETLVKYDFICLPSFSEMAPLLSLEALSLGVPVIANNHPSFISQSKQYEGFHFYEDNNVEKLHKLLKGLDSFKFNIPKITFNYDLMIEKHIEIYK